MAELIPEPTKTYYFLYGTDADPRTWRKRNRGAIAEYEGNEIDYAYSASLREKPSVDFIQSFQNYQNNVIITEEEFNALNQ
jgi:hypothetical protein